MSYRNTVKITLLIYKKPDIDEAQFQERFMDHARSLKDAMVRHGVLAYSQSLCGTAMRNQLASSLGSRSAAAGNADAVVNMTFPSWDAVNAWQADTEIVESSKAEAPFRNSGLTKLFAGEEVVFIENGGVAFE